MSKASVKNKTHLFCRKPINSQNNSLNSFWFKILKWLHFIYLRAEILKKQDEVLYIGTHPADIETQIEENLTCTGCTKKLEFN